MRPFDDAHVLVTGSSGAVGGAVARRLRGRWPRARLTLVDRDGAASERLAGDLGGARALAVDLAELDGLPGLLRQAEEAFGPVDGLVNCAGFMEVRRLETLPWERAWQLLAVDLLAPLRLLYLVAGGMRQRGGGFVVNVTSMAGRVPLKGCVFYGAAKAGLSMASEVARAELAKDGVRVVTVYPGPVASALERAARAQYGNGLVARAIPTGRAEELAARIVDAVEQGRPRVIYPSVYGLAWLATNAAARLALAVGPNPVG